MPADTAYYACWLDCSGKTCVGIKRDKIESSQRGGSGAAHLTINASFLLRYAMRKEERTQTSEVRRLNKLVDALCGLYTRIAQRLGVHRTFVSRVARGERRSEPVETALAAEYKRAKQDFKPMKR